MIQYLQQLLDYIDWQRISMSRDSVKRLQCPLNLNYPEHNKLYKFVMEETNGKQVGEFLRSLIRLYMEGRIVSSQINLEGIKLVDSSQMEDKNDEYLNDLVL